MTVAKEDVCDGGGATAGGSACGIPPCARTSSSGSSNTASGPAKSCSTKIYPGTVVASVRKQMKKINFPNTEDKEEYADEDGNNKIIVPKDMELDEDLRSANLRDAAVRRLGNVLFFVCIFLPYQSVFIIHSLTFLILPVFFSFSSSFFME